MDVKQLSRFERINVVGTSGSGKPTFARELAEVLNLPCFELVLVYRSPSGKVGQAVPDASEPELTGTHIPSGTA